MKSLELKYGSKRISLKLEEGSILSVLSGKKLAPLADPKERIKRVLKYPISSKSFYEIFRPGEKIAIVVSDRTRNVAAAVFLPIIIDNLNSIGIADKDIFIVFACGTHRLHTKNEHAKIVGEDVARRIELADHDCNAKGDLVTLGTTSRGTKVEINRKIAEADRVILTGAITYHYFAGYGGGRKAVLPGISAFQTIQSNHKLCLTSEKARTGVLEGNPVHEDMVEAAKMLDVDLIFNAIMDDSGRISSVFAGDLVAAHEAGCEMLDKNFKIKVDKKARAVIASAGGGTKDLNFVQSHKAMENASYVLEEGGTMVLLGESSEGFPSGEYMKYVNLGSAKAIEDELNRNFTIPGHTILSAIKKAERFKIIWASKLPQEVIRKMGIIPADGLAEAMNLAGELEQAYVMPDAYNTFPVIG
ncbi:MAG: nickel-dependent lactate racemase [bacterium]